MNSAKVAFFEFFGPFASVVFAWNVTHVVMDVNRWMSSIPSLLLDDKCRMLVGIIPINEIIENPEVTY